jgi:hypothetical protein
MTESGLPFGLKMSEFLATIAIFLCLGLVFALVTLESRDQAKEAGLHALLKQVEKKDGEKKDSKKKAKKAE